MRTITEGQAIELLHTHFDLDAPVAFEDVKKVYRRLSKKLHPDAGGSEDEFKVFSHAFDCLKQLYQFGSSLFDAEPIGDAAGTDEDVQTPKMPRETADGTPLSELGLGLGPTTNGKPCAECDTRGYKVVHEHGIADCRKCNGSGRQPLEVRCRACLGTGRFVQRRSHRNVECRACEGTGRFKHPYLTDWCFTCKGTGRGSSEKVVRIYAYKCHTCEGTGETVVLNPVLPKGRLSFTGKTPLATADVSKPQPAKETKVTKPGKDRLFGEGDPNRMQNLLKELAEKGIGGKRA